MSERIDREDTASCCLDVAGMLDRAYVELAMVRQADRGGVVEQLQREIATLSERLRAYGRSLYLGGLLPLDDRPAEGGVQR